MELSCSFQLDLEEYDGKIAVLHSKAAPNLTTIDRNSSSYEYHEKFDLRDEDEFGTRSFDSYTIFPPTYK